MAHLYVSTWRCSHNRVRISQIIKNACANASTQNMFIVIVPLGALTVTHIKDQYYMSKAVYKSWLARKKCLQWLWGSFLKPRGEE